MKRWITWTALGLVVVLMGWGVWRTLAARQVEKQALAEATTSREQAPLQLAEGEMITVQQRTLELGVPISGALRAVDSAMIKARVAGEIQSLTLRGATACALARWWRALTPTEAQARLRQAQQQADAAKAQVDINQRQLDNNKALVDQGFISATALVNSQASLQAAQATYQAARAAADVARKALDDTVLRSPISGQVAQRLAQPGERVGSMGVCWRWWTPAVWSWKPCSAPQIRCPCASARRRGFAGRIQPGRDRHRGSHQPQRPGWQPHGAGVPARGYPHQHRSCAGDVRAGPAGTGQTRCWRWSWTPCAPTSPAPMCRPFRMAASHICPSPQACAPWYRDRRSWPLKACPQAPPVVAGRLGTLREGTAVAAPAAQVAAPAAVSARRARLWCTAR